MSTIEIIIGIGIFFYVLTCVALIDVAQKNFSSFEKKIMWGFIAFIPFIGWILYFVFGYRKGVKPSQPKQS